MTETPPASDDSKLTSDDDGTSRMAEEHVEPEADPENTPAPSATEPADEDVPSESTTESTAWPAAQFSELIMMCASSAMVGLGLAAPPGSDTPQVDLPLARHFIDLLEVLQEASAGNLSSEDAAAIEVTLHELRMQFVHAQQPDPGA